MVCKTIIKNNIKTVEKRYYISRTDIELFSKAVRQHWSVEIIHWHLDVTFLIVDKLSCVCPGKPQMYVDF